MASDDPRPRRHSRSTTRFGVWEIGVVLLLASGCPTFADPELADDTVATGPGSSSDAGEPELCGGVPLARGFVCVAAGPYVHGCSSDCVSRPDWFPEGTAYPVWAPHFAELDPALDLGEFQIMAHEITVGEYEACVEAGRCPEPSCIDSSGTWPGTPAELDSAVSCLGSTHAATFCAWQGEQVGLPGALPTECQWEKAARGDVDARNYPTGSEPPTCSDARIGLFSSDGQPPPCPGDAGAGAVGEFPDAASPYGVLDLNGNVSEWTRSRMQCGTGDWVIKGEGWAAHPDDLLSARLDFRYPGADDEGIPGVMGSTLGARCILGPTPEIADAECPPPMADQSVCTDPDHESLRCEAHHDETGEGSGVHFEVARTIHVVVSEVDDAGLESITLQNSVGLPEVELIGAVGTAHSFPGPVKLHLCSREPGTGGGCGSTPDHGKGLATFETPSGNRIALKFSCPLE